jgi:hypothetical protein
MFGLARSNEFKQSLTDLWYNDVRHVTVTDRFSECDALAATHPGFRYKAVDASLALPPQHTNNNA